MSFLDFLYKVALESPNVFFGWFREIFSDLATLSLARSPAIKARFACFKNCFDRELMGSLLEATASRSVTAPPYPPQEVVCSNLYFGYLQQSSLRTADAFPVYFSEEKSDDRKCVCCSQANNKVTPKTKNRLSAENFLKNEFPVYLHRDIDCMGEFRKVMWFKRLLYSLRFGPLNMLCTRNPLVLGGCLIHY